MTEASRVQTLLIQQNDEINRLRNRIEKLEAALHQWDDLIRHQYSGSREAMSDLTDAAQLTAALLHGKSP
jgi:BMFP domain-containing protein YqiC